MDALEIAIKMEMDAISFYTEAAQKTSYPVGRKMFEAVAEDEKRHLQMITNIVKGLAISRTDLGPMKKLKTVFETMKDEMMQKAAATSDELEAFNVAMQMEKEGMHFYRKTLEEAGKDKERALFERLIEEEQEHYTLFSNTYHFLANTGNWFMWEERSIVEGG